LGQAKYTVQGTTRVAVRGFVELWSRCNERLAATLEKLLPAHLRLDGCHTFTSSIVPRLLSRGALVYDVGGGRTPTIDPAVKRCVGSLTVVGIDECLDELRAAPAGSYDRVVRANICSFRGPGDGDVVVCRSVLEHIDSPEKAIAGIASLLKPGGRAALFVPSRHAWYAKLNRLLPHDLKLRWIALLFPEKKSLSLFPASYCSCSTRELGEAAVRAGLRVLETRSFYQSSYFRVLFPLYCVCGDLGNFSGSQ